MVVMVVVNVDTADVTNDEGDGDDNSDLGGW